MPPVNQNNDKTAASAGAAAHPLWLRFAPAVFLLLWSGGYTAVKITVPYIEPLFLLAVRYVIVLAVLLPAWAIVRPALPVTLAEWRDLAVVGLLVQGLYFGATNVSIYLGVSATAIGIILSLQPILIALLAPRLAGEPISRSAWVGLLLGLAGAAVAILAKAQTGEATTGGIIAAVAGLVFITAGTLYEKRFGSPQHLIVANSVQCGAGLALALPAALLLETCRVTWMGEVMVAIGYLAIANSIIAMTLLFAMVRRGAAAKATALLFLVPPTSAAIALVVIGEPMPPMVWLGMALAVAGVVMVRRA